MRHFPRRMLKAGAQQRTMKRSVLSNRLEMDSSDEDDVMDTPVIGQWSRKNPGKVGSKISPFIKPVVDNEKLERLKSGTALDFYKVSLILFILKQLYSMLPFFVQYCTNIYNFQRSSSLISLLRRWSISLVCMRSRRTRSSPWR